MAQILNQSQHIEDEFETHEITGLAFVKLTTTYGTVYYQLLLKNITSLLKVMN